MLFFKHSLKTLLFFIIVIYSNAYSQTYIDNFNDINFDNWTTLFGTWASVSGCGDAGAIQSGNGKCEIQANTITGYGVYEYDIKIDGPNISDAEIYINYQDVNNCLHIALHAPGDNDDYIEKRINGNFSELTTTSAGLVIGEWAHVKIERKMNGIVNVYIDNHLHMSANVPEVNSPGDIVFKAYEQVTFDNLFVEFYSPNISNIYYNNGINEINFYLSQNYPNPFNPTTKIDFYLNNNDNINFMVFNAIGQEVYNMTMVDVKKGYHSIIYNAINHEAGLYFYKITTNGYSSTKRMLLIK